MKKILANAPSFYSDAIPDAKPLDTFAGIAPSFYSDAIPDAKPLDTFAGIAPASFDPTQCADPAGRDPVRLICGATGRRSYDDS